MNNIKKDPLKYFVVVMCLSAIVLLFILIIFGLMATRADALTIHHLKPGGDCLANHHSGDIYITGNERYCNNGIVQKPITITPVPRDTKDRHNTPTETPIEPKKHPTETPTNKPAPDKTPCNNGKGDGSDGVKGDGNGSEGCDRNEHGKDESFFLFAFITELWSRIKFMARRFLSDEDCEEFLPEEWEGYTNEHN